MTDGEFESVTAKLEQHNIFVGNMTLELELLVTFQDPVQQTYAELNPSPVAITRFNASVAGAIDDKPEAKDEVIRRISAIGKGRFAQRLAQKVGANPPPQYLRNAVEHIVQLVEESHARPKPRVRPAK